MRSVILRCLWIVASLIMVTAASADPYPPTWSNGAGAAVHYAPVGWPSEPANPVNCGNTCGSWKPYTRFQQGMNDPRTQDPSNGGTSPQAYVNVTSSCTDKSLPSIYYYLHQGNTAAEDVLMFRWRVESAPHNYATGPSAGSYGASNPWSSALWTVLFDLDGSGYRSLAAHLDGSTGSPSTAIDRLVGIWSSSPSQSLDYINDSSVHALGHNPTAFIGPGGKILNFHNSLSPDEIWGNGSSETVWDYGTTRARTVTQNSCTEYFIDYQIPIALLDASGIGGPKITRSTPIAMLFCTANSLNNPFQKDCAINKQWTADGSKPAPFGDYLSFNQTEVYSQPIVASVSATAPSSCPGSYTLKAKVQDTLALQSGVIVPSVQNVDFYYWYDQDGNGLADDASVSWTRITPTATLDSGTLNQWSTSWDASSLPKGKYLIGVQALDDNTKLDDGMTPTGVNNRTFSYVTGNSANKIYVAGAWISGQQAAFPGHSPSQTPSSGENWYGNPNVTGQQVALVGTAINACGVAPTIVLSGSAANVVAGGSFSHTITLTNPASNSSAVTVSQITSTLPAGFSYQTGTTAGAGGLSSANPSESGGVLTWNYGSPASLAPGASATLTYDVTATSTAGRYNAMAAAITSFGSIQSEPSAVAVDAARLSFSITPSANSIAADGSTQLTFALNYSNDSTVSVSGAGITASLPSGTTYVSCSGGSACANSSGNLSWTLGTLAAGGSGSATLLITLPASFSSSSLSLTAILAATAPDASSVTKTASSSVAVTGYSFTTPAAFTLTKTASATRVAPGDSITYTLSYANYGGTAASGVVITDTLAAGTSFTGATGGGSHASGVVTWNLGAVAAGASGSVTVTVATANPFTAANPAVNSASINWTGGSPVAAVGASVGVSGQACNTFYFSAATNSVGFDGTQKLAKVSPVPQSGDTGTSVTVTAPVSGSSYLTALSFYQDPAATADVPFDGNITTNIYIDRANGQGLNIQTTVYDYNSTTGTRTQLAQNIQLFSGSQKGLLSFSVTPSGTLAKNHRLLWEYAVRSNHASQTVQVQLQYGGTVTNAISGGSTFANSNAQYCVTPPANLATRVTVDQASISAGTTPVLKYTINYSNTGSASATNSSLVSTLPSGLTNCQYSTDNSAWSACSAAGAHTFNFGTLTAPSSGAVYVRGTVPSGTSGGETYTNNVSLSSDQTSAVTATAVTQVAAASASLGASLDLALTANTTSAAPGASVVYSLRVTNLGDTTATGVVVTNSLPVASYFTYSACTGGCSHSSGTLTWNLGSLAAGASQTYTYSMAVGSTGLSAGTTAISDDASAAGNASLFATSNSVTVNITASPQLAGTLAASPSSGLSPGDTITYTLTVQNTGNAAATSVEVSDPVPAGTQFLGSITASTGSGSFDAVNNRVVFSLGTLAAGASATLSFTATVNSLASGSTTVTNTASARAANAALVSFSVNATASAAASLELTQSITGASAYPAATLTANASSATVYVDHTDAFSLNQYVKIGSTVGRIQSKSNKSITLNTSVTASSGDTVVGAFTLNLNYRNAGNAAATAVSLVNTLPSGLGFYLDTPNATSSPSQGASGATTWTIGTLAPGESGSRSVVVFPTGTTGNLTSIGALSASNASTATANATVVVGGLTVGKSTSSPQVAAGGTASYTLTLSNSLSTPLTGVAVSDVLAEGFSYHTGSASVGGAAGEPSFAGDDTAHVRPQWTGLTVPASGSLVITFDADVSASAGGGLYQNEAVASAGAGVGLLQYDALAATAEDVTVLASNRGVLKGYVFYRNSASGSTFVAGSDLPLTGVRVEIYKTGADCSDPYSATCYVLFTDNNGYYQQELAAEGWFVRAVAGTGDLSASWDQVVGDNATELVVPDQGSVADHNGYKLIPTYTVTASAGTGGSISPVSRTVTSGNTTTFTLTPDTGYSIGTTTGTCGGSLSGSTFTTNAVTAACTVQANFTLNTYTVTFDLDGGTRTGGGALSQSVNHGSAATAPSFTAPTGKTFTGWSASFSSITAPITVTANYTDNTYTVTPSGGAGGSISPASAQTLVHGSATSFTLTADTGYSIGTTTGTCGGSLSGTIFTTSAVTADCTVQANFTLNSYTVTFDLAGGTRTGGGALTQSVSHGSSATAPTLTPPSGKTLTGWGSSFSSITGSLTVTALYGDVTFSVTPSAGTGGSISPSSVQTIVSGTNTSFTLAPSTGYSLDSVTGTCGGTQSGNTFTTSAITADCSVQASFTLNTYAVTFDLAGGTRTGGGVLSQTVGHGSAATAPTLTPPVGKVFSTWSGSFSSITGALTVTAIYVDATYTVTPSAGSGGSISPSSAQTITHGNNAIFTLTPATGFSLASVGGTCGGSLAGNTFSSVAVTADCTVIAAFSLNSYTVTFDLAGGTRTGGGALSQTVAHGSPASAPTLTPPVGKTFTGWSTDFSAVSGDVTIAAQYTDTQYTVTPSAGSGGSISPASAQTLNHAGSTSFTLTADTGFSLASVGGSCGGTLVGNVFTTGAITSNCSVQAVFSASSYSVTFDLVGGTRTGGGALSQSVAHAAAATAPVFTSPTGKTFIGWSTTFTTVTGPLTVTALYADTSYSVTASSGSGGSISPSGAQSVTHGASTSFTLTPASGYSTSAVNGTCGGNLASGVFTTSAVTADCSVQAVFALNSYSVVFDLAGGSRIGGGALSQSVNHGAAATAPDLTPPVGKVFSSWSSSFNSVTTALTVTALYTDATVTVTPSAQSGGTISPATAQTLTYGTSTSFTLSPQTGYSIANVSGSCGGTLTGNTYTTAALLADCTVQAAFAINSYTVTFDLVGGSRSGGGALVQTINHGSPAQAPGISAPVGKMFTGWSASFSSVTGDMTVTAQYGDALVVVSPSAGAGGSISPATMQTLVYGQATSFTLTADAGYSLAAASGTCAGNLVGNVFTTSAITADCSLQANFTLNTYTVTFDLAGGTATGGGALSQNISHGNAATSPNFNAPSGKTFTGWSSPFDVITGPLTVTALYGDVTVSVTPSVSAGGSISPASVQTLVFGTGTTFTLNAATGYHLTGVAGSCGGSLSGSVYTTDNLVSDCTVKGQFALNDYPVSFDLAGGTRTGGGALVQSVVHGSPAQAPIFTAPSGKAFSGWSTAFDSITGELTVTALYNSLMYSITPSATAGGSITPAAAQQVGYNSQAVFSLSPATGYSIEAVGGSCGGTLSGTSFTTAPVATDCTVDASFVLNQYSVSFDLDGGTRTGGGAVSQSIAHGASATAPVFIAPVGKTFTGWSSQFDAVTGALTVKALYASSTYSVTPAAGAGGSISPASAQTVSHGNTSSFGIAPANGYSVNAVTSSCGGSLVGETFTTAAVTADCIVQATFTLNSYPVEFDLAGGTYTGGGALQQTVNHGAAATAPQLTPPTGKHFIGWSSNFAAVAGPMTIAALYADNLYTVSSSSTTGGAISPAVSQQVSHGQSPQFSLAPETGYELVAVAGTCGGTLSGLTYTLSPVHADCTVQAQFAQAYYAVVFDLNGGVRTGGGELAQSVAHGSAAQVPEFTPSPGKRATGWSQPFTNVTGARVITALYQDATFSVHALASEGGAVSPTAQTITYGQSAQINLAPALGFSIDGVTSSCGGMLSGLTFTTGPVTTACTLSATFKRESFQVVFDLAGGTRTGGGELVQQIAYGAQAVAPSLNPPDGKIFSGWSAAFSSVTGNLVVNALYNTLNYRVTASASAGGAFSPEAEQQVVHGGSANFQINPATGFVLAGVSGTCPSGNAIKASGGAYQTGPIVQDCQVQFDFHRALMAVDSQGRAYSGEVLPRFTAKTFSLAGGTGSWTLAAAVTRGGKTHSQESATVEEFLAGYGAQVIRSDNGTYQFTAARSGRYSLLFTDADGQSSTVEFSVYPSVSFTSTYQESSLGKLTQVQVLLDDAPITYPVSITLQVAGVELTDVLEAKDELAIADGRAALLEFMPLQNQGQVDFAIVGAELNELILGDIASHRVELKNLALVPLTLAIDASQLGLSGQVFINKDGLVTLMSSLTGPGFSYDWSGSAPELGLGQALGDTTTFNPANLSGSYRVRLTIRELNAPNREQSVETQLRILADESAAYSQFAVTNTEPNRLPICTARMARVAVCRDLTAPVYMETLSSFELKFGRTSDQASWKGQEFGLATEASDIRDSSDQPVANSIDLNYTHLGYEVDFQVSGLTQAGQTVPVVIPLKPGLVIPQNAVWRKYSTEGWKTFVVDDINKIASAAHNAQGKCPSPADLGWSDGLNVGHTCVRLMIQDGGPNDADGRADGEVRDPSALAVKPQEVTVTTHGKGRRHGGGLDEVFILLSLGAALVELRRPRSAAQLAQVLQRFKSGVLGVPSTSVPTAKGAKMKKFLALWLVLACAPAQAVPPQEGDYYLSGQIGRARGEVGAHAMNARMAELGYQANAQVSGQQRTAWALRGGYQLNNYIALEAGFVDLGDVRTRLSGSAQSINDYLKSANQVHPRSAHGYTLSTEGRYPVGDNDYVFLHGGVLFARAQYDAQGGEQHETRLDDDRQGFWGLGYRQDLDDKWALQLGFDNFKVEREHIRVWGLGVQYRFQRGH